MFVKIFIFERKFCLILPIFINLYYISVYKVMFIYKNSGLVHLYELLYYIWTFESLIQSTNYLMKKRELPAILIIFYLLNANEVDRENVYWRLTKSS